MNVATTSASTSAAHHFWMKTAATSLLVKIILPKLKFGGMIEDILKFAKNKLITKVGTLQTKI